MKLILVKTEVAVTVFAFCTTKAINFSLVIADLAKRMENVELRLAKVEGKSTVKEECSAKPKDDDNGDDDFDLFASDEEDDDDKEGDEERKKLLEKYHDKKAKSKGDVMITE